MENLTWKSRPVWETGRNHWQTVRRQIRVLDVLGKKRWLATLVPLYSWHTIMREAVNNIVEKIDVFNKYFLSNIGMEQQSRFVSYHMLDYNPVYPN